MATVKGNHLFVYDVVEHTESHTLLIYGRKNNKTVCWRVGHLPFSVFYLEVQHDYLKDVYKSTTGAVKSLSVETTEADIKQEIEQFSRLKLNITKDDILKFVPAFENAEIEFDGTRVVYQNIAPVVSFQVNDTDDDTPNCWEDDQRKLIFVPELNMYEASPIHKARECSVPMLKIVVNNNPLKLPSQHINHGKLLKLHPTTSIFCRVWRETLSLPEQFALSLDFKNTGWISSKKSPVRVKEEDCVTNAVEEYYVNFQDLEVNNSLPDSEHIRTAFIDLHQIQSTHLEMIISLCTWQPNKSIQDTDEVYKFVFQADNSKLAYCGLPQKVDSKVYVQQFHLVKAFGAAVNEFLEKQDIGILIAYRWQNWMQKQFAKFKIVPNRLRTNVSVDTGKKPGAAALHNNNRAGIICYDAAKCFEDADLFPKAASYRIAHLAHVHLQEPYQSRILNPVDRVRIIRQLFQKFNTINILYGWSRVCGAPWQCTCDLHFNKMSEWIVLHQFYRRGFVIRQPINTKSTSIAIGMSTEVKNDLSADGSANSKAINSDFSPMNRANIIETGETEAKYDFEQNGGLVIEPERGIHECVIQMDFQSDYPSIIVSANLCFSTLTVNSLRNSRPDNVQLYYFQQYAELQQAHENNLQEMIKEMACIPAICAELIFKRRNLKAALKEYLKTDMVDQDTVNSLECEIKVTKLTLSTIYGCFKFKKWRFFCAAMQEYIAALGRLKLSKTKTWIETNSTLDFKMRVVAGDTDSLFVKAGKEMIIEAWDEKEGKLNIVKMNALMKDMGDQISFEINKIYPGLNFLPDSIYAVYAPLRKKHYLAVPFFLDGESFDWNKCHWKGIPLQEFGVAPFISEIRARVMMEVAFFLSNITGIVKKKPVNGAGYHDPHLKSKMDITSRVLQHISALVERFKLDQMVPQDFIISGKFAQPLHMYQVEEPPPQVQVARLLKALADIQDPEGEYCCVGDTIEMIVCHDFTRADDQQAYPAHIVIDSVRRQTLTVNAEYYLTKMVEKLHECLHPFQIYPKEVMMADVQKVLAEIISK